VSTGILYYNFVLKEQNFWSRSSWVNTSQKGIKILSALQIQKLCRIYEKITDTPQTSIARLVLLEIRKLSWIHYTLNIALVFGSSAGARGSMLNVLNDCWKVFVAAVCLHRKGGESGPSCFCPFRFQLKQINYRSDRKTKQEKFSFWKRFSLSF